MIRIKCCIIGIYNEMKMHMRSFELKIGITFPFSGFVLSI